MRDTFLLEIITPARISLKKEVSYVSLPGTSGYIGVFPDHSPLMTNLEVGLINMEDLVEGPMEPLFIRGGIAEVLPDRVTIMADIVEWQSSINLDRAQKAKARAEERLQHQGPDIDVKRAEFALKRSLARIRVKENRG
jgi:F-type H+-transporting ATPase subunit epsilon